MKRKGRLGWSAIAVIMTLLLSKGLGFVRQMVIASVFGASGVTDSFFLASEFMINTTGAVTTALVTVLVTVYMERMVVDGTPAAHRMASGSITASIVIAILAALVLWFGASPLAMLLGPGLSAVQRSELAGYLRALCLVPLLTMLQANLIALLNAGQHFVQSKLYGLLYNPMAIVAVLLLCGRLGIGVLVAVVYLAQMLFALILALSLRKNYRFQLVKLDWKADGAPLLRLLIPILLCNLILQLNLIGAKAVASLLGDSSASVVSYAWTLEQLVTGTFTAAMSFILLPDMAKLAAQHDLCELNSLMQRFGAVMLELLLFAALYVLVFAEDIVRLLYYRGAFSEQNVRLTAMVLRGFALGFPIIALRDMLRQLHFTTQNTRIVLIADCVSAVSCLLLALLLQHFTGVFGISAAVSIAAAITALILLVSAKRKLLLEKLLPRYELIRCLPATVIGIVLMLLQQRLSAALPVELLIGVTISGICYLTLHMVLHTQTGQLLMDTFKRCRM